MRDSRGDVRHKRVAPDWRGSREIVSPRCLSRISFDREDIFRERKRDRERREGEEREQEELGAER